MCFFMFVNLSGMYNCINVFVVYAECLLHTNSKTLHVVQNNVHATTSCHKNRVQFLMGGSTIIAGFWPQKVLTKKCRADTCKSKGSKIRMTLAKTWGRSEWHTATFLD